MGYKKMTVWDCLEQVKGGKIYLPAIQRKFVWGRQQIELLFDSMMRNYPIGTFLFWKLHKDKALDYVFYEFLNDYDERTPYNRRHIGGFTNDEIIGVLDGQQRLSSILIGLKGTHIEKTPYKRYTSSDAYEKMQLYLNLLSLPYELNDEGGIEVDEDRYFEFKFLTDEKAVNSVLRKVKIENDTSIEETMYWLKLADVTTWSADPDFDNLLEKLAGQAPDQKQRDALRTNQRFVKRGMEKLHGLVHGELINYFEVAKDDLEDILKIFIRVNSGGTVLNKTDLLFSTIVATWSDGRDKIEELLKAINSKGDGFSFGNEFLMRCCLMLSEGPIGFKVHSFKAENVKKIQDDWTKISESISQMVDLLKDFGFKGSLLTSQNATIIIAYYIYKGGDLSDESKTNIRKYLIHALLNRIYSNSQDQLMGALRSLFRKKVKGAYTLSQPKFSFDYLLQQGLPGRKSLAVTKADLEMFLSSKKGAVSFFVLSLLYPQLKYQDQAFDQDHIHPFKSFNDENFTAMSLSDDEQKEWIELRDTVPNLQLINRHDNNAKRATPLIDWMTKKNDAEYQVFLKENYFPDGVGLEFEKFKEFYEKRKTILLEELQKVLSVSNEMPELAQEDWESQDELESEELVLAQDNVS